MDENTLPPAPVAASESIAVQLCHARPGLQILQDLKLAAGSTIATAIAHSSLAQQVPELDLGTCKVGIFGKLKQMDTVLREGDRVEIYRPLLADPKTARRERAGQKRAEKNGLKKAG